jgi:hypothetical protein
VNLDDDNVRLAIKRIVALVRWCEARGRPFPRIKYISEAVGIGAAVVGQVIRELKNSGIVEDSGKCRGVRFLRMVDQ